MPTTFSLSGTLKVQPKWVETFGVTDVTDAATATHTAALTEGTGAGEANGYWKDQVTVPAGGTVTLDLSSLSHKVFGGTAALGFSTVKVLVVSAAQAVAFAGSAANRWESFADGAIEIGAGGVLYAVAPQAGWPVTPTSRIVTFGNGGAAPAVVDVYIAGVTA